MTISIIIPAYNEEKHIGKLVCHLRENSTNAVKEIIVIDGGSTDHTREVAEKAGASVLMSPVRGRAVQMNYGADHSIGEVLYFVHADTLPPESFAKDLLASIEKGYRIGGYRFRFDSPKWYLKVNSFFTRYNRLMFRGGDQTLFITRSFFEKLGRYREDYLIMEEYDLMIKARKQCKFCVIQKDVLVSARKYDDNNYLKVNFANLVAFKMFQWGYSQDRIVRVYYRLLKQPNYKFP